MKQIFSLLYTLRRFKPLGISLKVNTGGETHVRFAFSRLSYFSQIFTPFMTITDNLRNFVCLFQALKGPLRVHKGPQWLSMD